jgi:hypothetical protein
MAASPVNDFSGVEPGVGSWPEVMTFLRFVDLAAERSVSEVLSELPGSGRCIASAFKK